MNDHDLILPLTQSIFIHHPEQLSMSTPLTTRTVYREDHEAFSEQVRRFWDKEVVPFHAQWDQDGIACKPRRGHCPRRSWCLGRIDGIRPRFGATICPWILTDWLG